jgi:ubiquinone/menaquinone biosynthesis C-methylase UbiE
MKISQPAERLCDEYKVIAAELPLAGARILELGCGKAEKTRTIAQAGKVASILALEVDALQQARNLQISDLPNVRFGHGAAEAIPVADSTFDIVMMFKSLHHVAMSEMNQALSEIRRVLRPGGLAWISEPIYAGAFNEILRLFHDEKKFERSPLLLSVGPWTTGASRSFASVSSPPTATLTTSSSLRNGSFGSRIRTTGCRLNDTIL